MKWFALVASTINEYSNGYSLFLLVLGLSLKAHFHNISFNTDHTYYFLIRINFKIFGDSQVLVLFRFDSVFPLSWSFLANIAYL